MLIEEVNSFFNLDIETDDYDTIGGWMYSKINIPPVNNQRVDYAGEYEFIIEETDHLRISRLLIRKIGERKKDRTANILAEHERFDQRKAA